MKKMGRPKKDSTKTKTVAIRLSDEDYERFMAYASNHKMTITAALHRGVQLLLEQEQG